MIDIKNLVKLATIALQCTVRWWKYGEVVSCEISEKKADQETSSVGYNITLWVMKFLIFIKEPRRHAIDKKAIRLYSDTKIGRYCSCRKICVYA